MDLNNLGSGGIGGIIGTILAFFGFNRRMNKLEEDIKSKTDLSFCDERHKVVDEIRSTQVYIRDRLDSLYDYVKSNKGA